MGMAAVQILGKYKAFKFTTVHETVVLHFDRNLTEYIRKPFFGTIWGMSDHTRNTEILFVTPSD